jgi:hypothetical protein
MDYCLSSMTWTISSCRPGLDDKYLSGMQAIQNSIVHGLDD